MRTNVIRIRTLTLLAISTFLFGYFSSVAFAEKEAETDKKEPTSLSLFQKKTLEYALLEYGMLETQRQRGMTLSIQSELTFVLERLVEIYCMPDLPNTLEYVGPATGEKCLTHLAQLELFHPENPVVLCARHGIDSDSCKDAYDSQYITSYFPAPRKTDKVNFVEDSTDFLVRLNAPAESEMAGLASIESTLNLYKQKPTAENKRNLEKTMSLRIRHDCNPVYYRLMYEEPSDTWIASFKAREKEVDPLHQLVEKFSSGEPDIDPDGADKAGQIDERTGGHVNQKGADYGGLGVVAKEVNGERFQKAWRVRLLSNTCQPTMRAVLNYDQESPDAVCYREGFSSYNCIHSLRARRSRIEKAKKRVRDEANKSKQNDTPKNGFASF